MFDYIADRLANTEFAVGGDGRVHHWTRKSRMAARAATRAEEGRLKRESIAACTGINDELDRKIAASLKRSAEARAEWEKSKPEAKPDDDFGPTSFLGPKGAAYRKSLQEKETFAVPEAN